MSKLTQRSVVGLLCAVFLVVLYRAKTQSFTIDEAFAFHLYVDKRIEAFFQFYDACNHVLHTLLTKLVRYFLGTSELVLRIPSLLGCALYLAAVYRFVSLLLRNGIMRVIAAAVLTLHPLMLDFFVASRGYGLAVALLLWSMLFAIRSLTEQDDHQRLLFRAGCFAGLSIAANLTMLVPVAALGIVLLLYLLRGRFWSFVDSFAGPGIVIAFIFLVIPLSKADRSNFYVGTKTLQESFASLTSYDAAVIPSLLILLMLAVAQASGLRLIIFTLALSIVELIVLNKTMGVPYPFSRTGLYLIPLFLLSVIAGIGTLEIGRKQFRVFAWTGAALLSGATVIFLAQWNTRYFPVWRFDASTNIVMDRLISDNKARGGSEKLRIGSVRLYEQSLNYYRKRRRLHFMQPVVTQNLETEPLDYYVLDPETAPLIDKLGLQVVYKDELSGTILARPS